LYPFSRLARILLLRARMKSPRRRLIALAPLYFLILLPILLMLPQAAAAVEREHESYCSINPEAERCQQRRPQPRFAQSKDIRIDWQYQDDWYSLSFSEGGHRACQEAYVHKKHAYYSQSAHKYVIDDPCPGGIRFLARQLQQMADREGFDRKERIEFALNFVRGIPYQYDDQSTSKDDYARYGYETVLDGAGDCEDHAILFASLLREMCVKSYLIDLVGAHIVVGVSDVVAGRRCTGMHYVHNGESIYYCEPTACKGAWCGEVRMGQNLAFASDKDNPFDAKKITPVYPACYASPERRTPKTFVAAIVEALRESGAFDRYDLDRRERFDRPGLYREPKEPADYDDDISDRFRHHDMER
jgi:hypothetical protein